MNEQISASSSALQLRRKSFVCACVRPSLQKACRMRVPMANLPDDVVSVRVSRKDLGSLLVVLHDASNSANFDWRVVDHLYKKVSELYDGPWQPCEQGDQDKVAKMTEDISDARFSLQNAIESAEVSLDIRIGPIKSQPPIVLLDIRRGLREHMSKLEKLAKSHNECSGQVKDPEVAQALCRDRRQPYSRVARLDGESATTYQTDLETKLSDKGKTVMGALTAMLKELDEALKPVDDMVERYRRLKADLRRKPQKLSEGGQQAWTNKDIRKADKELKKLRKELKANPRLGFAFEEVLNRDPEYPIQ